VVPLDFPKSHRLLNSGDFQRVFDQAPLRASHKLFLMLARPNGREYPRLGLIIAKKHIRLASRRNRLKRLIRETFRHQQQNLGGIDVIVMARKGMDQLDNPSLIHQLNGQWRRLARKAQSYTNDPTHKG